MRKETRIVPLFNVLNKKSLIEAKISDHHMLILGSVVFLNMMMQGLWNAEKSRYNNGFGIIESDAQYQARISLVVRLLAEIVYLNPHIVAIGLAEAPIKAADINYLCAEMAKHVSLRPFLSSIIAERFTLMGVATLFNVDLVTVKQHALSRVGLGENLTDRIQCFTISDANKNSLTVFNMHLPFDMACSEKAKGLAKLASDLFSARDSVLAMGDFNFHPRRIVRRVAGLNLFTQKNNNVLIHADKAGRVTGSEYATVDGVLQSFSLPKKLYRDAKTSVLSLGCTLFSGPATEQERAIAKLNWMRNKLG